MIGCMHDGDAGGGVGGAASAEQVFIGLQMHARRDAYLRSLRVP
jgi:hypothetical protein